MGKEKKRGGLRRGKEGRGRRQSTPPYEVVSMREEDEGKERKEKGGEGGGETNILNRNYPT